MDLSGVATPKYGKLPFNGFNTTESQPHNAACTDKNVAPSNDLNVLSTEIYSANGQIMFKREADVSEIDISAFPDGIYYIRLETKNNDFFHAKFIKQ